ncbi:MAG: U32 family peptidase [Clostridia bacterium]|nr:U32 family peptidase [Clostridia bacterium]
MKTKPELLSPAGNPEKLKAAVMYGADAVYLAGKMFGMRAASGNFTDEELEWAVQYCHSRGVKVYVTLNVMPRTAEYSALTKYVTFLRDLGADAVIVGDLGVFSLVREVAPNLDIHISTQASAVSAASCNMWYKLGAKRVVLARELTFREILDIKRNIPEDLELEAFVHGAMCISYSGRCLLSNYFTGRDANHGTCAQSCRWVYSPVADPAKEINLSETNRPAPAVAVAAVEDGGDTFFMSSRDTSMIEHIRELEESGIASYKIEGRVKSAYYTAVVTNTYRMAIDEYRRDPASYVTRREWIDELDSVSHREYGTGFYFTPPHEDANTVTQHGYIREKAYIATAVETSLEADADGLYDCRFIERNKLVRGERVEMISPGKIGRGFIADTLRNEKGEDIESAPHPGMIFRLKVPFPVMEGDILRGGEVR